MRTAPNEPEPYRREHWWGLPASGADRETLPLYLHPEKRARPLTKHDAEIINGRSLWSDLRQALDRTMVHWTLVYFAGAWLVLQMMDVLTNIWGWPVSAQRVVCLVLALGLPPSLVVAWFHGERGQQQVTALEVIIVGALLFASGAIIWAVCST